MTYKEVVLVDDCDFAAVGLRLLLEGEPWVGSCRVARSRMTARALIAAQRPDLVLVAIMLEAYQGVSACRALVDEFPGLRAALITDGAAVPRAAIETAGAAGFVSRRWPGESLLAAVARGGQVALDARDTAGLSDRELCVLIRMVEGRTNRGIAAELGISSNTVKQHTMSIYGKLGARNRAEAVRRWENRRRPHMPSVSA